jgi:hypothetical protein
VFLFFILHVHRKSKCRVSQSCTFILQIKKAENAGVEATREQKKNFLQIWREENKKKLMLQKKFLLLYSIRKRRKLSKVWLIVFPLVFARC